MINLYVAFMWKFMLGSTVSIKALDKKFDFNHYTEGYLENPSVQLESYILESMS